VYLMKDLEILYVDRCVKNIFRSLVSNTETNNMVTVQKKCACVCACDF
jgi:hypothetical protein